MEGQAQSNMPLQLFQSWGHNKSYLENSVDQVQMVSKELADPDQHLFPLSLFVKKHANKLNPAF